MSAATPEKEQKYPEVRTEDATKRRELYELAEVFNKGMLKVSNIHEIFYEESGNPNGQPALVVHGGPGGGCPPFYRQFFNPKLYRIIMFDQRGCERSLPFAELKENTTWDLVADIEKLRVLLKVDRWVVFGGSWGSTLSLAYAQTHPGRVKALVLRGIFTLRRSELLFFYQEGSSWLFPDHFEEFVAPIPKVERGDLMSAYYRRLTGANEEEKMKCARAWTKWEMATSRLIIDQANLSKAEDDKFALAFSRIECHYFVNGGFFNEEDQLVKGASALKNIPGVIVQGRYDVVCPAKTAWDLHMEWREAELVWVADSGHSCKEPGIVSELVQATDKFASI